ncbi:MAG TPA: amidohydrolase family protein [Acidimicrobiales bacterium]|nr:amidohydrolase family protein [Acidimicrobiales bacterium]
MTVVDLWVNALTGPAAEAFLGRSGNEGIPALLGGDLSAASSLRAVLGTMDECGVDVGVVAAGLAAAGTEQLLEEVGGHADRLRVALVADRADRPVRQCARLRQLAQHPAVALVRVTPLVQQYPLNDKLYYPLYATCAELGLPVSINLGVPGPRVRSACQHPELLEDVLIDFEGLTVIGAHMGHPFESLLMQYMLKWPDLYLSNSAYLATYMDPGLVAFMDSSRGRGRVLFASDHPFLPLERAIDAARALPLSADALEAYLGGTSARLLRLG